MRDYGLRTTDHRQLSSGFSLIELLVAMTVLALIVMIMSTIFHQSTVAWDAGTRKAEGGMTARATLGFMTRKLQTAVADSEYLGFQVLGNGASEVQFVSLDGDVENGERLAKRITFDFDGEDVIEMRVAEMSGDYGVWDDEDTLVLCTNVTMLRFYPSDARAHSGGNLPEWMGIALGLKRKDEVSRVGARSAGHDKQFGTDDDLHSQ